MTALPLSSITKISHVSMSPQFETHSSLLTFRIMPVSISVSISYLCSGASNDVTALFSRFGADGLKLVHAAFACNPSLNRSSRQESIEAANELFEAGGAKGKYSSALSDLYQGVTDLALENHGKQKALTKTKSKSKSRFFG